MATPLHDLTTTSTGNAAGPATFSHTIAADANFVIVRTSLNEVGTPTPSAVSVGGQACTKIDSQVSADTFNDVSLWYLKAPPTGAQTVSVSYTGTAHYVISASSYKNVNQTAPIGTPAKATGTNATITVNAVSAAGELVVDGAGNHDVAIGAVGGGQTSRSNTTQGAPDVAGAGSEEAGAASVTMSWATTTGQGWNIVAVALKPSADGGLGPPRSRSPFKPGQPNLKFPYRKLPYVTSAAITDITLALTGVAGTGSPGTLTPSSTIALTGVGATGASGNFTATQILSGVSATGGIGTLTPSSTVALTGVAGTSAVGSVAFSFSFALTGVSSAAAVGSLTPSATVALTGAPATAAVGALSPNITIGLTGVSASGAVGDVTVSVSGDITLAITGVAATGAAGTMAPSETLALTGVAASAAVGSLTPSESLALTGVASATAVGTATPSTTIGLTGVESTGQTGTVTAQVPGDVTVALSGVSATGQVGSVAYQAQVAPVADLPQGAVGGGSSSIDRKSAKQRKKEDDDLTKTIRDMYRRLASDKSPAIAAQVEAIIAPITSQVVKPTQKVDVPRDYVKKAEIELRAMALTIETIKANRDAEIALRMADQELARKQAQRVENMRRIQLILQAVA